MAPVAPQNAHAGRARAGDDLKAQRVRQLLSNYYGSDTSAPVEPSRPKRGPASTSSRSSEADRPVGATDLDSKDFNVDK